MTYGEPRDVSCASANECVALVLDYDLPNDDGSTGGVFALAWNGSTWYLAPRPSSQLAPGYHTISCTADDWCMAAGGSYSAPLAATYTWTNS